MITLNVLDVRIPIVINAHSAMMDTQKLLLATAAT